MHFCHMLVTLLSHSMCKHGDNEPSFATVHTRDKYLVQCDMSANDTLGIFTNNEGDEEEIYPVTVTEIAQE